MIRIVSILLLIFILPRSVFSQQTPTDIRPMLKSLPLDKKLQVQEYLRHLGSNLEDEIQSAYQHIAKQNQAKAVQFIELLKQDAGTIPVTSVVWDRDTLFFGDLEEGTELLDSFSLTNTGQAPYVISDTKTTCDCTVLHAPSYPVMPGESAVIRLKFNSGGKLGVSQPALLIYDNSSPNKRSILFLKGNITARKKPHKYPWQD